MVTISKYPWGTRDCPGAPVEQGRTSYSLATSVSLEERGVQVHAPDS